VLQSPVMAFRGLFVGIDRYRDSRIPWLSGAVRDAAALHALFTDTVGEDAILLRDDAATRAAISGALAHLRDAAVPDDVVILAFAGHGSETHELIPYDADTADLRGTCISLDALGEAVEQIPGETLLCVLDCCFSGGFGSRVFATGLTARELTPDPVADALARFVGRGRVALTASAFDQPAMESVRSGHGLLTNRLLEALQGAAEVREGDQINLYRLVEYVTRTVEADARRMGAIQTPTLRGQLDGVPLWPVFAPGARYSALFPEQVRPPATAELSSLAAFGLSDAVIGTWSGAIAQLNDLQLSAINDFGVLDGENVVVSAPTSSGKTMIGELAALQSAQRRRRAVFLLPMKALVNDKFDQFTSLYAPAGIATIRATGDDSDDVPAFLRGQFDLALLTYEKYAMLALASPHVLDLAMTVVVDEAQILADQSRGPNLEFLLTLLNTRRAQTGTPQIITLSAVVGDIAGMDRWLGGRHLASDRRPVPLVEGTLDANGTYQFVHERRDDGTEPGFVQPLFHSGSRRLVIPLVAKLTAEGKKVLVFRQSRGESVACAVYLSQSLGLEPATATLEHLVEGDVSASTRTLRRTLAGGVAFHNTDLDRDERRRLEEDFRDPDSAPRVIVATPTLAVGVNTPASAVVIVGLTHPGRVPTPYTVAEYKNMVGRAGRLGYTERGESYLIPEGTLSADRGWHLYVHGTLERLQSRLVRDGDPRSLMLRVMASRAVDPTGAVAEDDVVGFLDASFAALQAREGGSAQWTVDSLRRAFAALVTARLIGADGARYRLTALGRFAGEFGIHVDSIQRLVHGLQAVAGRLNSVGLITAAQLTDELDDVYLPVNARARNTEVPRWPGVLRQQGVPPRLINALSQTTADQAQAVRRAKRAAAAAMWIAGMPMAAIERQLNQHLRSQDSRAGAVRAIADRTRDLLPAVAAVVRELAPEQPVDELADRTRLRLEFGIPAQLLDVLQALEVDLTRTDWLSLHEAGLHSLDDLRALPQQQLRDVLGSDAAAGRLRTAIEAVEAGAAAGDELVLPEPAE
jgi:helicase